MPIQFEFDAEEPSLCSSLWMWFYAAERSPDAAMRSRELLVAAIATALEDEAVLQALG
jgi:hypothetical protein